MVEVKADIVELKEDVAVLKEDVSELKEDVSVLKEDMVEVKADIVELKEESAQMRRELYDTKELVNKNYSLLEQFFASQQEFNTEVKNQLKMVVGMLDMHSRQISRNTADIKMYR